jgi:D-cysteine desulfhydrase
MLHEHGAELRCYKTLLGAGIALYTSQRLLNPGAYFLASGGSSPLGTVGVVNAMFELRAQVNAGVMPEPDFIFCPLGSSGTMAGLSLGGILAGLKSKVIGVRVTMDHAGPVPIANKGTVQKLMRRTLALLMKHSPEVPAVALPEQRVLDSYFGEGYGRATRAGGEAMARAMELEGIRLDPTYTAKTFAAVRDFIAAPENARATVLYWHTYHSTDNSALAASVDYHALPKELHRVFEGASVGAG